jgi:Rod binding domain-containing protein
MDAIRAPGRFQEVGAPSAAKPPTPDEIRQASEQFEAIFLRQILRDLRKTATLSGEPSFMTGFYTELFDEHVADHLARAGGLGLAGVIRAYLEGGRR